MSSDDESMDGNGSFTGDPNSPTAQRGHWGHWGHESSSQSLCEFQQSVSNLGAAQSNLGLDSNRPLDDASDSELFGPPEADGTEYTGFDPKLLWLGKDVDGVPGPVDKGEGSWLRYTSENINEFKTKPHRAMRILIPVANYKPGAESLSDWKLQPDNQDRQFATAALASLQFAGSEMGFPSGDHAEKARMEKAAAAACENGKTPKPVKYERTRTYEYIPGYNVEDQLPMMQFGYEEIWNEADTDITMIGLWIWVFHPYHSTAQLVSRTIESNASMYDCVGAGREAVFMRQTKSISEAARLKQAGLSKADLNADFERTITQQHRRIYNMETLNDALKTFGGNRMFVHDFEDHINCAAARRGVLTDSDGLGSKSPLAPEFCFNAKRQESLAFGAINNDGTPADIHPRHLNPTSYFNPNGSLRISPGLCLWVITSKDRGTPLSMRLPRPLKNAIVPGPALILLFKEEKMPAEEVFDDQSEASCVSMNESSIKNSDYIEFQSFCSKSDKMSKAKVANMKESFASTRDSLEEGIRGATFAPQQDSRGLYNIMTEKSTDRVSAETKVIEVELIDPWYGRERKKLQSQYCKLMDDGTPEGHHSLEKVAEDLENLNKRYVKVKRDSLDFHMRRMFDTFGSEAERATEPPGHVAAYDALMELIKNNGSTASMAFPGNNRKGRQMTSNDRGVFHEYMEFQTGLFSYDAKVRGRDIYQVNELLFQYFHTFADFGLVLALFGGTALCKSEKVKRFCQYLPKGTTSTFSGDSELAGMNGNRVPSNGTLMHADETPKTFLSTTCDSKQEHLKEQITDKKSTYQRTVPIKKGDGPETHMTVNIHTDHSESLIVTTNLGPLVTKGLPDDPRFALVMRCITMVVRRFCSGNGDKGYSWADFVHHQKQELTISKVATFQLVNMLVAMCLLCVKSCPWLLPDFSFARKIWNDFDNMLKSEYGYEPPEYRRKQRREYIALVMAIQEAVAHVYLYKQTAVNTEVGKPGPDNIGKRFDPADLSEIIKMIHIPSRVVILAAATHSLSYTTSTSLHGLNVLTSFCQQSGIGYSEIFKKMPTESAQVLSNNKDLIEPEPYMNDRDGANKSELKKLECDLRDSRKWRMFFNMKASSGSSTAKETAVDGIKSVLKGESPDTIRSVVSAVMPTYTEAATICGGTAVVEWANGNSVKSSDGKAPCKVRFHINEDGSIDPAWLIVYEGKKEFSDIKFGNQDLSNKSGDGQTASGLNGYHALTEHDAAFMMKHDSCKSFVPKMPNATINKKPSQAFCDAGNAVLSKESKEVYLRKVGGHGAHEGEKVVNRKAGSIANDSKIHAELDKINNNFRIPHLAPFYSTNIETAPILRHYPGSGLEISTVAAFNHMKLGLESSLSVLDLPGVSGLQEEFAFPEKCKPLRSSDSKSVGEGNVSTVPHSSDVIQIAWALTYARRLYDSTASANTKTQFMLNFPGFKNYKLLSIPMNRNSTVDEVEVDPKDSMEQDADEFDYIANSIGGRPSEQDIEDNKRLAAGKDYMHGISGDLHDYKTWLDHGRASLLNSGLATLDDPYFKSLEDTERMLIPRSVESRSKEEGTFESKLNICTTWPQTFSGQIESNHSSAKRQATKPMTMWEMASERARSKKARASSSSDNA